MEDCENLGNLEKVTEWKKLISEKTQLPDGRPVPVVLFYNKSDSSSIAGAVSPRHNNDC